MPEVKRPEFSWWPYRAVALAVPLLAVGAAAAAAAGSTKTGDARELEIATVFFAVLGAGNAYLFAIAIGDLGKTVLAVPAGGFAGFVAVHIFGHPIATVIYLILLGILTIQAIWNGIFRAVFGCLGLVIMFFAGATVANLKGAFEPGASTVVSYPFVCGVVAACMPYDRSVAGIRSAWMAGTLNAIYGLFVSAGIMIGVGMVAGITGSFFRNPNASAVIGVICVVIGVCLANFFCARSLFYSVYRVSDDPPKSDTEGTRVAEALPDSPANETPANPTPESRPDA